MAKTKNKETLLEKVARLAAENLNMKKEIKELKSEKEVLQARCTEGVERTKRMTDRLLKQLDRVKKIELLLEQEEKRRMEATCEHAVYTLGLIAEAVKRESEYLQKEVEYLQKTDKMRETISKFQKIRETGLKKARIESSKLKKEKAAVKAERFKKAVRDYFCQDVSRLDFSAAKILKNKALNLQNKEYGYKSDSTREKLINEVKREFKTG